MAPLVQPGALDRRIEIRRANVTTDATGQQREDWSTGGILVATTWANKRDTTARETIEAGREAAAGQTVFRIRYRSGITSDMRIVCEGATYDIEGQPTEYGRKHFLEILTSYREATR